MFLSTPLSLSFFGIDVTIRRHALPRRDVGRSPVFEPSGTCATPVLDKLCADLGLVPKGAIVTPPKQKRGARSVAGAPTNRCKVCGKRVSSRAKTCGTACRSKLSRTNKAKRLSV